MAISEQPFPPLVDQRSAAFARLVARILDALNLAAERRRNEGVALKDVARKLGWHNSAISRLLNGTSHNMTLRTVSDLLWALDFEPKDFEAEALEDINPKAPTFSSVNTKNSYIIKIDLDADDTENYFSKTRVVLEDRKVLSQ